MNSDSPCRRRALPGLLSGTGLLCLLLVLPASAPAETPSSIMSKVMLAMMDAMGNLALQFKNRGGGSFGSGYFPYGLPNRYNIPRALRYGPGRYPGSNWTGGVPLQSPLSGHGARPRRGMAPLSSPAYAPLSGRSPVDGIWLGQGGELVLVMYGHFRIYASAELYRDGLFEILGDKLVMYDPQGNQPIAFDYRFEEARMALRSPTGAVMLFKRLPIPISPQNLFFDPPALARMLHPGIR